MEENLDPVLKQLQDLRELYENLRQDHENLRRDYDDLQEHFEEHQIELGKEGQKYTPAQQPFSLRPNPSESTPTQSLIVTELNNRLFGPGGAEYQARIGIGPKAPRNMRSRCFSFVLRKETIMQLFELLDKQQCDSGVFQKEMDGEETIHRGWFYYKHQRSLVQQRSMCDMGGIMTVDVIDKSQSMYDTSKLTDYYCDPKKRIGDLWIYRPPERRKLVFKWQMKILSRLEEKPLKKPIYWVSISNKLSRNDLTDFLAIDKGTLVVNVPGSTTLKTRVQEHFKSSNPFKLLILNFNIAKKAFDYYDIIEEIKKGRFINEKFRREFPEPHVLVLTNFQPGHDGIFDKDLDYSVMDVDTNDTLGALVTEPGRKTQPQPNE